jgi:hypothetical protein
MDASDVAELASRPRTTSFVLENSTAVDDLPHGVQDGSDVI